jgi:hypothetical protein
MDTVTKIVDYIASYIGSVPAESWYTLGALLGSSSVVVAIVAWIKRRHLRKYAESLGRTFVTLNVVFWSAITTVLSFILTNGSTFASFLPFLGTHWPQVVAIATVGYNVAKPSLQWFKDRQAGKKLEAIQRTSDLPAIDNPNYAPELAAQVALVNSPAPSPATSFGTEAAGRSTDLLR